MRQTKGPRAGGLAQFGQSIKADGVMPRSLRAQNVNVRQRLSHPDGIWKAVDYSRMRRSTSQLCIVEAKRPMGAPAA